MSEEPKAPQVPEPSGETPPEEFALDNTFREDSSLAPLSEDQHRVTGDLDSSHAQPFTTDVPELPLQSTQPSDELLPEQPPASSPLAAPPPEVGESRRTESLMRRITGSIRRSTGPLGKTGPLPSSPPDLPAQDVDEAFGMKLPSELPGSTGETASPPQADQQPPTPRRPETTNLVRRITGSLKRVTGPLGNTSPLRPSRSERSASVEEKPPSLGAGEGTSGEPAEKRKRSTGPLGSILSGILRGAPGAEEQTPMARRQPQADDYVSEIRQNLASEEIVQPKKSRGSGLLQLITGNLKRMTGSLGRTAEIAALPAEKPDLDKPKSDLPTELEPPRSEIETEIEEVLLEDRLAGTAVSEPTTWAEPEDIVIELGPPEPGSYELEEPEISDSLPEVGSLRGDEPISLLESGAIAALDKAAEESHQAETEPDWMAEIRHEAAEAEAEKEAADSAGKHKGITSPLRDFIAGILRSEEKQPPSVDSEVSDDLVTGRLGLDLDSKPPEADLTPAEPLSGQEVIDTTLSGEYAQQEEEDLSLEGDTSFLERFQARFGQTSTDESTETGQTLADFPPLPPVGAEDQGEEIKSFVPYEPLQTHDTGKVFTISPEDEKLLWGAAPPEEPQEEPKTIRADDYWDPLLLSLQTPVEAPEKPEAPDANAAVFPAGAETAPILGETKPLKRRTTGKLNRETARKPFEDIRSILLDDYQAAEQHRLGKAAAPTAAAGELPASTTSTAAPEVPFRPGLSEPDIEELAAPRQKSLGEWLGTRTTLQKIILVELILVVLALLTAVPFFFYMLLRSPQAQAVTPNKLPADLPYPTGLTLPGGWHFQLGRSTMQNSNWRPAQSEWLEGTELRRVVALPWNRQTEAVVRSFQAGDEIELELSNSDTIKYTVERIGQVSVEDTSIYSDVTPSLIVILYTDEKEMRERWVVFCKR